MRLSVGDKCVCRFRGSCFSFFFRGFYCVFFKGCIAFCWKMMKTKIISFIFNIDVFYTYYQLEKSLTYRCLVHERSAFTDKVIMSNFRVH